MRRFTFDTFAVGLVVVCTAGRPAKGDDAAAEGLCPAALAAGSRALAERVLDCRTADGRMFRAVLGGDAAVEVALRRLVFRQAEFDGCRAGDDGQVRVRVWVVGSALLAGLTGDAGSPLRSAVGQLGDRRFMVVGAVMVRGAGEPFEDRPTGWEDVTSAGMALAAAAARRDLADSLLDAIRSAEIEDGVSVGRRLDSIGAGGALAGRLEGFEPQRVEYDAAQVCVAYGRLSVDRLVQLLRDVVDGRTHSSDGEDLFRGIEARVGASGVTAIGYGLPPMAERIASVRPTFALHAPAWAEQTLTTVGRGEMADGAGEGADRRALARAAAKADALMRLAGMIDDLSLPGGDGLAVGDYIRAHPDEDDVWSAALHSADTSAVDWQGDICSVTVKLELRGLWEGISPGLDEWLWRRVQSR